MTTSLALIFIAIFLGLFYAQRLGARTIDRAWQSVATQLGGQFRNGRFLTSRRLDAEVGGIAISVDHYTEGTGSNTRTITRIRANARAPSALRLRAAPTNFFSDLARAVGFQDVATGDADFDQRWMVKASLVEWVPAWLNKRVREHLRRVPNYGFELNQGKVIARRTGLESEPKALINAIHATVAFADGSSELVSAFSSLSERYGGKAKSDGEDGVELVTTWQGKRLSVTCQSGGSAAWLEIKVEEARAPLSPFEALGEGQATSSLPRLDDPRIPSGVAVHSTDEKLLDSVLVSEALTAHSDLAIRALRRTPRAVTLELAGLDVGKQRLRRATELAVALADDSIQTKAYR